MKWRWVARRHRRLRCSSVRAKASLAPRSEGVLSPEAILPPARSSASLMRMRRLFWIFWRCIWRAEFGRCCSCDMRKGFAVFLSPIVPELHFSSHLLHIQRRFIARHLKGRWVLKALVWVVRPTLPKSPCPQVQAILIGRAIRTILS